MLGKSSVEELQQRSEWNIEYGFLNDVTRGMGGEEVSRSKPSTYSGPAWLPVIPINSQNYTTRTYIHDNMYRKD